MGSPWDTEVGSQYLEDPRYAHLWKHTGGLTCWSRIRLKSHARRLFEALDEATDESSLWGIVGDTDANITLDALSIVLPEWATEFVERFNARSAQMANGTSFTKFEMRPAVRGLKNIIIGICAPAGRGKTCSSLRIATGLARGGEIALIDTDYGRSTEYAPLPDEAPNDTFNSELPLFRFSHVNLPPPHSPERFLQAVSAAARLKPTVLIIDNITDELMGQGGQLDMRDNAPPHDKFGWIEPKGQHRALMNEIRRRPWYVILTIKAKDRVRPANSEEKQAGMKGIIKTGWEPQCDGGLLSDFSILQLVDRGIPNGSDEYPWKLSPFYRHIIPMGVPLSEETGRRLAEWVQPEGRWATQTK